MDYSSSVILFLSAFFWAAPSYAQTPLVLPQDFTVEGRLYDLSGLPINSSVNIMLELLVDNGSSNCVIYSETQANINLSSTDPTAIGVFALRLGTGSVNINVTNTPLTSFFQPGSFSGQDDTSGSSCTIVAASGMHRLLRIKSQLVTAGGWDTLSPDTRLSAVPSAMFADTANSVQGLTPTNFIQVVSDGSNMLTQQNVANVFNATNYPVLQSLLNGTDAGFISSKPTSTVSLNGQTLTNLNTPINATDAVTKSYADSDLGGKTLNLTGIGPGTGNGETIVWDATSAQWVAQTAASVSSVGSGTGLIGGPITSSGTLSVDVGTSAGKILQLNTLAQIPAVDGSLLTNVNATKLASRAVASTAPTAGQGLVYNATTLQWEPHSGIAITALTGDVVATGPGSVSATIQPNGVNASAKINNSGIAVNRLVITDAATGTTLTYGTCNLNQIYQWTSTGWACADVSAVLSGAGATVSTYGNSTQVAQVSIDAQGRVSQLSNVNIAFPVSSVAGRTGIVTLNTGDISGLGSAALQNYGTAAGNLVQLSNASTLPALDGSALTNLNATRIGTRPVSSSMPTAGQVLTWNVANSDWEPASVSGGTVTSVSSGTGLTGGPITSSGTLSVNVGTAANQIVQLTASAQLPAVDGNLVTNINAANLQGRAIASASPTAGQVLTYNATTGKWDAELTQTATNVFVNGGNSFGGTAILGTTDANSLQLWTANTGAVTILPSGTVGIGTMSPNNSNRLQVLGTTTMTDVLTPTSGANNTAFTQTATYVPASTVSAGTAVTASSANIQTAGSASLSNASITASQAYAQQSTSTNLLSGTGVSGAFAQTGSGTTTSGFGGNFMVEAYSGTVQSAAGVSAEVVSAGGTISSAMGLQASIAESSGSIGTGYGLYLGSIQATTRYGVYQSDPTAANYLAGNLGIGTGSPVATLDVASTSSAGLALLVTGAPTVVNGGLAVGSTITDSSISTISNLHLCTGSIGPFFTPYSSGNSFQITCNGAAVGSVVSCSPNIAPRDTTITWSAYISVAGIITVNVTSSGDSGATAGGFTATSTWKCLVAN